MEGQAIKTRSRSFLSGGNNPPGAVQQLSAGYTLAEMCVIVAIIGILCAVGIQYFGSYRLKVKNMKAIDDIKYMSMSIGTYRSENGAYPQSLSDLVGGAFNDPWGNPYQYLNIADGGPSARGKCRKDRNLNPINTDYDLYSMGLDGKTASQLNSKYGQDDVIRAQDGAYIGLAGDF